MAESEDNKIVDRDSFGRIKKGGKVLSSEAASQLAQKGNAKRTRAAQEHKQDRLEKLVTQAGYEIDDCPELLLSTLEEIAQGGSRVYSGVNAVLRLTGQDKDPALEKVRLQPGECCSRCGRDGLLSLFQGVDQDTAIRALQFLVNLLRDSAGDGIRLAPLAEDEHPDQDILEGELPY